LLVISTDSRYMHVKNR